MEHAVLSAQAFKSRICATVDAYFLVDSLGFMHCGFHKLGFVCLFVCKLCMQSCTRIEFEGFTGIWIFRVLIGSCMGFSWGYPG